MSLTDTLDQAETLLETSPADAVEPLETLLRGGLPDTALEARTLLGLGRAYGRSGRFFEAAVLGRRLLTIERSRGSDGDVLTALGLLLVALLNAKALERAEPHLVEIETRLADVPHAEAPQLFRILYQARYSLALLQGNIPEATVCFKQLQLLSTEGHLGEHAHWFLLNIEFHLATARDDLPRMEAILSEALDGSQVANVYVPAVTLRHGLACAYARRGRLDAACDMVSDAIDCLQAGTPSSEVVIDDAAGLARLLHTSLGETTAALAAAGIATSGLLERIRQIEESATTLSSLLEDDDRDMLAGMQADFRATILEFVREIRSAVRTSPSAGGPPSHTVARGGRLLLVCAWCGGVELAPDTWVALSKFVPRSPLSSVTHEICPDCTEREVKAPDRYLTP